MDFEVTTGMSTHKLLIASHNLDKVEEIRHILADLPVQLLSMQDFPDIPPVIEDRETISGNAVKKALETAMQAGIYTLADDTGLFIDALDGAPGVYAARFAGPECTYRDNRTKALHMLAGKTLRDASFRTAVVLAAPKGVVSVHEGRVNGRITEAERGNRGFGYDAIFEVENTGRTYAEMDDAEKNACSHRALALISILPVLQEIFKN